MIRRSVPIGTGSEVDTSRPENRDGHSESRGGISILFKNLVLPALRWVGGNEIPFLSSGAGWVAADFDRRGAPILENAAVILGQLALANSGLGLDFFWAGVVAWGLFVVIHAAEYVRDVRKWKTLAKSEKKSRAPPSLANTGLSSLIAAFSVALLYALPYFISIFSIAPILFLTFSFYALPSTLFHMGLNKWAKGVHLGTGTVSLVVALITIVLIVSGQRFFKQIASAPSGTPASPTSPAIKLNIDKLVDALFSDIMFRANMMGISEGNKKEFSLIQLPQALQLADDADKGKFKPTPTAIIDLSPEGTSIATINTDMPLQSHGTSMADIVRQVAGKRADIWKLSAGIKTKTGKLEITQMAEAIRYAVREGARVIIISLSSDGRTETIRAIDEALDQGVVVVMAVGNEGVEDTAMLPSIDKRILMVGSVLHTGKRDPNSNFGTSLEGIKVVDVYAPGRLIVTLPDGKKGLAIGTSFASPVAGGVAALMIFFDPTISGQSATRILEDSVQVQNDLPILDSLKAIKRTLKEKKGEPKTGAQSNAAKDEQDLKKEQDDLRVFFDSDEGKAGTGSQVDTFGLHNRDDSSEPHGGIINWFKKWVEPALRSLGQKKRFIVSRLARWLSADYDRRGAPILENAAVILGQLVLANSNLGLDFFLAGVVAWGIFFVFHIAEYVYLLRQWRKLDIGKQQDRAPPSLANTGFSLIIAAFSVALLYSLPSLISIFSDGPTLPLVFSLYAFLSTLFHMGLNRWAKGVHLGTGTVSQPSKLSTNPQRNKAKDFTESGSQVDTVDHEGELPAVVEITYQTISRFGSFADRLAAGRKVEWLAEDFFEVAVPGKSRAIIDTLVKTGRMAPVSGKPGVFTIPLSSHLGSSNDFSNPFLTPPSLQLKGIAVTVSGRRETITADEEVVVHHLLADVSLLNNALDIGRSYDGRQNASVDPTSVQGLVRVIGENAAAKALARLGPVAVPELIAALQPDNFLNYYVLNTLTEIAQAGHDVSAARSSVVELLKAIDQKNEKIPLDADNSSNRRYSAIEPALHLLAQIGARPEDAEFCLDLLNRYDRSWDSVFKILEGLGLSIREPFLARAIKELSILKQKGRGRNFMELIDRALEALQPDVAPVPTPLLKQISGLVPRRVREALDEEALTVAVEAVARIIRLNLRMTDDDIAGLTNLEEWFTFDVTPTHVTISREGTAIYSLSRVNLGLRLLLSNRLGLGEVWTRALFRLVKSATGDNEGYRTFNWPFGEKKGVDWASIKMDLIDEDWLPLTGQILLTMQRLGLLPDDSQFSQQTRLDIISAALKISQHYLKRPTDGLKAILKVLRTLATGGAIVHDKSQIVEVDEDTPGAVEVDESRIKEHTDGKAYLETPIDLIYLLANDADIKPAIQSAVFNLIQKQLQDQPHKPPLRSQDINAFADLVKVMGPGQEDSLAVLAASLKSNGVTRSQWDNLVAAFTWMNGSATYDQTYKKNSSGLNRVDDWYEGFKFREGGEEPKDIEDLKRALLAVYYDESGEARSFDIAQKTADLVKRYLLRGPMPSVSNLFINDKLSQFATSLRNGDLKRYVEIVYELDAPRPYKREEIRSRPPLLRYGPDHVSKKFDDLKVAKGEGAEQLGIERIVSRGTYDLIGKIKHGKSEGPGALQEDFSRSIDADRDAYLAYIDAVAYMERSIPNWNAESINHIVMDGEFYFDLGKAIGFEKIHLLLSKETLEDLREGGMIGATQKPSELGKGRMAVLNSYVFHEIANRYDALVPYDPNGYSPIDRSIRLVDRKQILLARLLEKSPARLDEAVQKKDVDALKRLLGDIISSNVIGYGSHDPSVPATRILPKIHPTFDANNALFNLIQEEATAEDIQWDRLTVNPSETPATPGMAHETGTGSKADTSRPNPINRANSFKALLVVGGIALGLLGIFGLGFFGVLPMAEGVRDWSGWVALVLPVYFLGLRGLIPFLDGMGKNVKQGGEASPPIQPRLAGRDVVLNPKTEFIEYNPDPTTKQFDVSPALFNLLTHNKNRFASPLIRFATHFLLNIFLVPLHEGLHAKGILGEVYAFGAQGMVVGGLVGLAVWLSMAFAAPLWFVPAAPVFLAAVFAGVSTISRVPSLKPGFFGNFKNNEFSTHENAGWKIHLRVEQSRYKDVHKWLWKNAFVGNYFYKHLKGGEAQSKDFTIYVGSRLAAKALAQKMTQQIGHLIMVPGKDITSSDVPLSEKVWARFDAQVVKSLDLAPYGKDGFNWTKDDMSNVSSEKNPTVQAVYMAKASKYAFELLAKKYGEYFTGEATTFQDFNPMAEVDSVADKKSSVSADLADKLLGIIKENKGNQSEILIKVMGLFMNQDQVESLGISEMITANSGSLSFIEKELTTALKKEIDRKVEKGEMTLQDVERIAPILASILLMLISSGEVQKFAGLLNDIPKQNSFKFIRGFVSLVDTLEQVEIIRSDSAMENRHVIGVDSAKKDLIGQLAKKFNFSAKELKKTGSYVIDNNMEIVLVENSMNALSLVRRAQRAVLFSKNGIPNLNLLILDKTTLPRDFFNLSAEDLATLKKAAAIYFVNEALQAFEIDASLLPDWNAIRARLIQA